MADWESLLKQGIISAGAYAKHVGQNIADAAMYPGKVMQAGMRGEPFDLQGAADWGAGTAMGMIGGGARFAPKGAVGSSFSDPLYHGSPVADLERLQPSTRGPLGPGVYTSPAPTIAKTYAGEGGKVYQLPEGTRDIFRGAGHRTDAEWFGFKADKQRLLNAAEPGKRAELTNILDKSWSNDGYPVYQRIMRLYGGDEAAQGLFRKAGFEGISGLVDGPETLLFNPQSLK